MINKLASVVIGYGLAWAINTPQGRKAAGQLSRAALRQLGNVEKSVYNAFKKGGVHNDGQTRNGEASGEHLLRETEADS